MTILGISETPLAAAMAAHTAAGAGDTLRAPPVSGRLAHSLMRQVEAAWRRCLAWQLRRQTRAVLVTLDDHLLCDIGLNRTAFAAALLDMERQKLRGQLPF